MLANLKTLEDLKKLTDADIGQLEQDLVKDFPNDPIFSVSTDLAPGIKTEGYVVAETIFAKIFHILTGKSMSSRVELESAVYYLGASSHKEYIYR